MRANRNSIYLVAVEKKWLEKGGLFVLAPHTNLSK